MGRVTQRRTIVRVAMTPKPAEIPDTSRTDAFAVETRVGPDTLAAEEPLEIRVGGSPLAVTMRTPGDDLDLAIGFLLTEGVIHSAADVVTAKLCAGDEEPNSYNVVDVRLAAGVPAPEAQQAARNFYTTSSCGVCGKASIEAVRTRSAFDVAADPVTVEPAVLALLPDALRRRQRAFETTGGLHAAGLFTPGGELLCLREDVGRHNAVDKVVGWAVRQERLPLAGHVLMVSGRASFELCQKAWMAGLPVLAAVSAPSTLAVDLAAEAGLTLIGFLRGPTFNVYAGAHRVLGIPPDQAGPHREARLSPAR
ncbi:formate dehydrogenase accessory sulfurtransferase FdhD [Dactylosporangium darangshiense]|uniref:Sulfur carrier protein FdhD n=1 Tax=Dactylosporangium darangshiense TaxID=579108 RepID=A0ABP8CUV2_9ACTN